MRCAPHATHFDEGLAHGDRLFYRHGNPNGTLGDLLCAALRERRDADIALSPGFRWDGCVLPGEPITREQVYDQSAIT